MDVEIVPTLKTGVLDVSNGSSPQANSGSDFGQVGVGENGVQGAYEQPSFLVNSFVEDVDEGVEYVSGNSEPEFSGHGNNLHEDALNMEGVQEVQEQGANTKEVELNEEQEKYLELLSDSEKSQNKEENDAKRALKSGTLTNDHCVKYHLPPESEDEFAVFDLVWGKVKSHPWWPGQIFHPSDSSEKAMKYYKRDCYLVAYFGDRTFAWNDASVLKPFRNHFSQAERQSHSEAFQNAVNCALEEVSRRVELGLSCSCLSDESYDKIKYQIVENSGIREESSKREGVDRSTGSNSFKPDRITEYVRALALFPTSCSDRLELTIAKAQLLAFNHLRGYDSLPEFEYYEGLVDFHVDTLSKDQGMSRENGNAAKGPRRRKHDLRDIVYQRRKEKSVLELMGDTMYYLDGEFESYDEDDHNMVSHTKNGKRRRVTDDFTSPLSTQTISLSDLSSEALPSQQSFKVGERIRKAAFQMTGSTPIIKGSIKGSEKALESSVDSLTESQTIQSKTFSLENMLSQLHVCGQDPMKRYSFFRNIITFFSEFRNLAVTTNRQKLRKIKKNYLVPVGGSPETFDFDDKNDSYWTDMVIHGDSESKPARRGHKRKDEQVLSIDHGKPLERKRRKYTRKKSIEKSTEKATEEEKKIDLPAELMLKFGETGSVPLGVNLNKMFKCFGPLKESETEVDMESRSARVVFKKRSDAEVAYSSAATFNIFGSTLVNYELNTTPTSLRSSDLALTSGKEDAT